MKGLAILPPITLLMLGLPSVSTAQPRNSDIESLRREVAVLRDALKAHEDAQQDAILKELREIKALLAQRPVATAPQPTAVADVALNIDGDGPFKGSPNAGVTLIEFSDYQCPFCANYFRDALQKIDAEYGKTGKVKYLFRNFPLEAIHPQAFKAAEAASCAGDQNKYWEMHDRLFQNQQALGAADLPRHAEALGLDLQRFSECLEGGKHSAKIRKDMAEGQKAGVTGTPTFFLGFTEPGSSRVKAVRRVTGAQPYESFKEAIDSVLSRPR